MTPFLFFLSTVFCILDLFAFAFFGAAVGSQMLIVLTLVTAVIGLCRVYGTLWALGPKNRFAGDDDVLTKVMVVEKMLVAVSGLLLLMPGLVTDTFGLLLLFPTVRRAVAVVVLEIRTQRQQRRKVAKPRLALMHSLESNPLTDDLFAKEMRVCTDADMVPQYNVYGHAIWDPAISNQGRQRRQRAEARFRGRAASQALLDRVA